MSEHILGVSSVCCEPGWIFHAVSQTALVSIDLVPLSSFVLTLKTGVEPAAKAPAAKIVFDIGASAVNDESEVRER
jgi:hypothetical protein